MFGAVTLKDILEQVVKLEHVPVLFAHLVLVALQLHPQLKQVIVEDSAAAC